MSIPKFEVPKFLKPYRQQNSQQPHTSQFTDATRRGSEYCPYCGGYHSTDAERDACAISHSITSSSYRCPRCGQYHSTLYAAEHCCEEEKRYEREYDPQTYVGYATEPCSVETIGMSSNYSSYGNQSSSSEEDDEGILGALFSFGSKKAPEKPKSNSGGGFLDSYLNAGSSGSKKGGSGGGFFG